MDENKNPGRQATPPTTERSLMRLWSLHPCYLDAKGLVALWREGLLARKVLLNQTKGYRNHPQLERFKVQNEPVAVIDHYLLAVFEEASERGYHFDGTKIGPCFSPAMLVVTNGQLKFELCHLKQKLKQRNIKSYDLIVNLVFPIPHPIFSVIEGDVAAWEKVR
jgi:hypothetical protein